jgi:hypothetical protein
MGAIKSSSQELQISHGRKEKLTKTCWFTKKQRWFPKNYCG